MEATRLAVSSGSASPAGKGDLDPRPHIVLVIPRGEAVRNFLYSKTLPSLARSARVTVLSVVDDPEFDRHFESFVDQIVALADSQSPVWLSRFRTLIENAHDRRQWSRVHQNQWRLRDSRARQGARYRRLLVKLMSRLLAHEPALRRATRAHQIMAHRFRDRQLDELFDRLQPDLVFNGSHIHGQAGELPVLAAHARGIPTAGFIFSWDNLTSRSRIMVPYDTFLVWHEAMRAELLEVYPEVRSQQVAVTGTPQFDFHFDRRLKLSRKKLCSRIGIDPARPFVLYTTGIANHFFDEHRHVESVIDILSRLDESRRPQLVVRTYIKGTSPEMLALAERGYPDVYFPEVLWEPHWQTPRFEDLEIYSNLLRHCALGINAASTVTLELLMFDKPAINLDFDPPGTDLPWDLGYERHIRFDHYRPVANSPAVMVARSTRDLESKIARGLNAQRELAAERRAFLTDMFGDTLDGQSGERVASVLVALGSGRRVGR